MSKSRCRGGIIRELLFGCATVACVAVWPAEVKAQSGEEDPVVLGTLTPGELFASTDTSWLLGAVDDYVPEEAAVNELRGELGEVDSVKIYYGSWCGDSRRELPRMLATLKASGFSDSRIRVVGVDNSDEAYKRSPDGETDGKSIYRVPTLTVSAGGEEIGRIIELPRTTIERDLLAITGGESYEPNYSVFPYIDSLMASGLISQENFTPYSLAKLLRLRVSGAGELANVATVLALNGQTGEALAIARTNVVLHTEEASTWVKLGKLYAEDGEFEKAKRMIRSALLAGEGDEEELLTLFEEYVTEYVNAGGDS